jgi:hypothetical protein
VTNGEQLREAIKYFVDKADEALDSAKDELQSGRLSFSVNRLYYACFYAISAVLLQDDLKFKKHAGLKAAFHQHLIKPGKIGPQFGELFNELFEARQRGDYLAFVSFDHRHVADWLNRTQHFLSTLKSLIKL